MKEVEVKECDRENEGAKESQGGKTAEVSRLGCK